MLAVFCVDAEINKIKQKLQSWDSQQTRLTFSVWYCAEPTYGKACWLLQCCGTTHWNGWDSTVKAFIDLNMKLIIVMQQLLVIPCFNIVFILVCTYTFSLFTFVLKNMFMCYRNQES